jgi:hypothetical protein
MGTLVGRKFGKLTVNSRAESIKPGEPLWNCQCDCGSECQITEYVLRDGNVKSCGCYKEEQQEQNMDKDFAVLTPNPKDKVEFNGKVKTLSAHAKDNKIGIKAVISRLEEGWNLEKALTTPTVPIKKKKEK